MKRILSLSLAALMLAVSLAGCGAAPSPGTSAAVPSSGSLAPSSPPPEAAAPADPSVFPAALASADIMAGHPDAALIQLSDEGVTVNGAPASANSANAVYTANDIVFYLEGQDFTYGEGTEADVHSQAEADAHTVVHITQPGEYILTGTLSAGQVAVDLGDEAKDDPDAVVTLILNGADITCTVAPAVIFYQVYECGSDDPDTASADVDTSAAGANVLIADGSVNNIQGSYVARIYESVTLSEDGTEVVDSKKLHKYDAAFYSRRSMNLNSGTGTLNIRAENEGLDSELHLTINGGNVNIYSGNDGINTNEDGVSVTTVNGGNLNIVVEGGTGEGDGIDSNGWLVFNGGTVTTSACATSGDAGIDADMGIHLNGGTVTAGGNMFDHIAESQATYAVFQFASRQPGGTAITLKDEAGAPVGQWAPANDFTCLVVSSPALLPGTYTLWSGSTQLAAAPSGGLMGHGGGFMGGGQPAQPPEGAEFPEGMERPKDFELPEGAEPPEGGLGRGQRPEGERPEGFQPPEDRELPEDFDPAPGGFGGRGGKGSQSMLASSALSTEFILSAGANTFLSVCPAQTLQPA